MLRKYKLTSIIENM